LGFLGEDEPPIRIEIDSHEVAKFQLRGCHQARQRRYKVFLYRAFQMTSPILCVGAFFEKEILDAFGTTEKELLGAGRFQDALLHHLQFEIENLLQVCRAQGLENYNLVNTVHELRCELASSRFYRCAIDLLVKAILMHFLLRGKSEAAVCQVRHLGRPEVGSHNNDAPREVDSPVVTQSQSAFIQDSE